MDLKCKARPAILSFGWKEVHQKVHVGIVGWKGKVDEKRPCEWCGHRLSTRHIFKGDCKHVREVHGHYEALLTAPHSKRTIRNELLHVWAIWKGWCRMVHENEEKTSDTFVSRIPQVQGKEIQSCRFPSRNRMVRYRGWFDQGRPITSRTTAVDQQRSILATQSIAL